MEFANMEEFLRMHTFSIVGACPVVIHVARMIKFAKNYRYSR
jgi:hypothetical protein